MVDLNLVIPKYRRIAYAMTALLYGGLLCYFGYQIYRAWILNSTSTEDEEDWKAHPDVYFEWYATPQKMTWNGASCNATPWISERLDEYKTSYIGTSTNASFWGGKATRISFGDFHANYPEEWRQDPAGWVVVECFVDAQVQEGKGILMVNAVDPMLMVSNEKKKRGYSHLWFAGVDSSGWPVLDYNRLKKFGIGTKDLFHADKLARYRLQPMGHNPWKAKAGLEITWWLQFRAPVTFSLKESREQRVVKVFYRVGGFMALVTAVFGVIFVQKHPKYMFKTLRGHEHNEEEQYDTMDELTDGSTGS